MATRSFVPNTYYPTSPRSGNEGVLVFRMQNMILRGESAEPYAEVYGGSLDLGESIATSNLTGTVACTINDFIIVGTTTAFTTELHLGQRLEAFGGTNGGPKIPLVVDEIIDDTHFRACRAPQATSSGCTVLRFPRIYEVGKKRGTSIWGNVVEFDLGTLIGVGDGTFRLNGTALTNTLVLTRTPKIAILSGSTYNVFTLGMNTPASLSAADQAGGAKNMQTGVYSVRAVPARQATAGYNNPSPKAEVTIGTAGHMIRATFPAADTTHGQDAWMIFVTQFSQGQGVQGPWYQFQPVEGRMFVRVGSGGGEIPAAGGTYDIDYNDAEVASNDLLTFDNDAPQAAEFIAVIGGLPVYISCHGKGETSPGPFIVPAKVENIEAAPMRQAVSTTLPDTIIGFQVAQGRLYLMCVNTLQIAQATQATSNRIPPVVVRPYWRAGFKNPEGLIFVDGGLVGMTNHGLARSLADGDEGSEEFDFATALDEFLRGLNPGHCILQLDPKNNAVVLFHSADTLNSSGFWTTRAWMYGLRQQKWIGDILLTSTTSDSIVCSAAVVNGQLEFLMGGRTNGGTSVVKTYRWDDPTAAQSIPYYIAWQFSDWGVEDRPKHVGPYVRVTAKQGSGGTVGIHGVEPGDAIPVAQLELDNAGSKSAALTLPASTLVTQENVVETSCDNLMQLAIRVDGTWNGTGIRDRIDEVVVEAFVQGARR